MAPQLTLSALWRAAICAGSAALPHVRTRDVPGSALGTALHKVQELRARGERPDLDAIAEAYAVPADDRGWYYATARRCLPVIPPGALAEVPLAYFDDGDCVNIDPPDASHRYAVESNVLPGMLDLIWSEPEPLESSPRLRFVEARCPPGSTLVVADYKTGNDDNVPPPDRNWQLRAGALMAARWTGATRVIPAICYLEPSPEGETNEGRWEMGSVIDAAGLDAIEFELRDILHRVETARFDVAAGAVPGLVTGDHCTHCPARTACPAHLAEVRSVLDVSMIIADASGSANGGALRVTRHEAKWLAERLPSLRAALEKAELAVKYHADCEGPLALASGKVYEGKDETRMHLDPNLSAFALGLAGYPLAAIAYAFEMSKTALFDFIAADFRDRGVRGAAGMKRDILAAIDSAGGITRTTVRVYKARHGGAVLPVACGTPELEDLGPLDD